MTHCLCNETAGHQTTPGSPHTQVPEELESKKEPKPATVAPGVCQVTEHTVSVPRKRGQGMVPLKPTVRSRWPAAPSSCRGRGTGCCGPSAPLTLPVSTPQQSTQQKPVLGVHGLELRVRAPRRVTAPEGRPGPTHLSPEVNTQSAPRELCKVVGKSSRRASNFLS